jgi:peptidoglycan hydrolase-like protein with peptidoglycan-binding domain
MRARVLAPLVAGLVGVAAGTTTALLTVDASPGVRDEPESITDPLGLGIPMVRLGCTGQGLLVVGYGDTSGTLREAIADNDGEDLSYVDAARSCDTVYGPERKQEKPAYAVVLGPFDGLAEPCAVRMTPAHRADFVTNLRAGNEISVKCVCVLPESSAPVLRPGMPETESTAIWIRSLQGMLADLDPEGFPKDLITGVYDEATEARIRELQDGSTLAVTGVVDEETWDLFQRRACDLYDF